MEYWGFLFLFVMPGGVLKVHLNLTATYYKTAWALPINFSGGQFFLLFLFHFCAKYFHQHVRNHINQLVLFFQFFFSHFHLLGSKLS